MSCLNPLYAIDYGLNPDTGKHRLRILPRVKCVPGAFASLEERFGKGHVLQLPCGHCLNCKISYSRTWAIRCLCEALYYDENWFVTFTFNDEHYVKGYEDLRRTIQLFLKRLRKVRPGVRYFGCCEKGDKLRNHYHLILFGLSLPDIKCIGRGPKGGYYYESKFLNSIWSDDEGNSMGFLTIGDVNFTTCSYVAQYCLKKVYKNEDDKEQFVMMSTKPGIGTQYFKDHWEDIYETDNIYLNNGKSIFNAPPRYFDKLLDKVHPLLLDVVKTERINKAQAYRFHNLIKVNAASDEELIEVNRAIAVDKYKDHLRKRR